MAGVRGRFGVVIGVLAVVASACSSSGSSGGAPTTTKASETSTTAAPTRTAHYDDTAKRWPTPTFVEGPCPMPLDDVEVQVTCGTVQVPENRLDPKSKTIELAVARLHSRSATPKADPVVQLEGGPGFPSLVDVAGYAKSKILDERDYIIWDQRGTGSSTPNLDCTETNDAIWGIFATTDSSEVEGKRIEDSLERCRDRLRADGVDLSGYDTTQNAADLADLRVALGIDEWNLRGVSYGSALAIETVRNHPEGVRSVLLDSVVPPDGPFGGVDRGKSGLRAYRELYAACAAQPSCEEKYGDLEQLFREAAAKLDAEPYRNTVVNPATGKPSPVAITGQDLWAGLFNALYDETLIPALPGVAQAIVDGNAGVIDQVAKSGIPFVADQVEGMTASVDCADRERILDPKVVAPFLEAHPEMGALVRLSVPETGCERWGVDPQPTAFNTLLRSDVDVPILMMEGRFDPITPPAGTERVAKALGVPVLRFPNAGHGAVSSSDCARDIYLAFLDDPKAEPDTACIDDLGPPTFG
ncbi:MAG: alpha/beta hydrolase [Acidimicrobiales bacterium]